VAVVLAVKGLSCTERDNPADRVIGGHTDGDPIAGDHLDTEAAHPAAQLRKHLVSSVALHAIEAAGVNRYYRPLHINQVVFAQ